MKDVTVDHMLLNRKADFETAQCYTLPIWSWRKAVFCLSEPLLTGDYGILFLENSFVLALRLLLLTHRSLPTKTSSSQKSHAENISCFIGLELSWLEMQAIS